MKKSTLWLIGISLLTLGLACGWLLRGQRPDAQLGQKLLAQEDAGSSDQPSPGAGGSNAGKSVAASAPSSQLPGTSKRDSPKETAQRIFREMLTEEHSGGPPLELFNFLQALADCDAETLKGMLAELQEYRKDPKNAAKRSGGSEFAMMILAQLGNLDPMAAIDGFAALKADGGRADSSMLAFAFASISKNNPEQAQAMIERLPDDETRREAQMAWLMVKAKSDPEGALKDLLAMPKSDEDTHSRVAVSLLEKLTRQSPEKALEAARSLSSGDHTSRDLTDVVIAEWAKSDPKALATWAVQVQDAGGLLKVQQTTPEHIDAAQLRRDFSKLGADSPTKNSLAGELARQYAKQDLPAAVAWTQSLSGANQISAQGTVGEAWIDRDPMAASAWLTTWPQSTTKDRTMAYLVDHIRADDPESALLWAAHIQSEDKRYLNMAHALNSLQAKNPEAATAALAALPEAERGQVERRLKKK